MDNMKATMRNWDWLILFIILMLSAIVLALIGLNLESNSVWSPLLLWIAGAVFAVACVDLFHEWFVARRVRREFQILSDFSGIGVYRVCNEEETYKLGAEDLKRTRTLRVLSIGANWLRTGPNKNVLDEMLRRSNGIALELLIPDPVSESIVNRYRYDEPTDDYQEKLSNLAANLRYWRKMKATYPNSINVSVYKSYPSAIVCVYDKYVYVNPVLYKRRAKDNLTLVFSRPSNGAEIYEDHLDKLKSADGTVSVSEYDFDALARRYPVSGHDSED